MIALLAAMLTLTDPALAEEGPAPATVQVGWDGVRVGTADGTFRADLRLLLVGRVDVTVPHNAAPVSNVFLRNARPMLQLHAWHGLLTATLQAEFLPTPSALDVRVDVTPNKRVSAGVGLMVVPFNRAWLTPLFEVLSTERSAATGALTPGRRIGGYVSAGPKDGRFRAFLGAYDPTLPGSGNQPLHAPMGLVRLEVHPLGPAPRTDLPSLTGDQSLKVLVGLAILGEPKVDANPAPDHAQVTGTMDLALNVRGFHVATEAFGRWASDASPGWSASAQLGQFLVPRHLQLAARYTAVDVDVRDGSGPRHLPEVVLSGFVEGTHLRTDLRYRAAVGGRLGLDHLITLQGQVRF